MKPRPVAFARLLLPTVALISSSFTAQAADIFKANNTNRIQDLSSWFTTTGGPTNISALGASDVGVFDNTISGAIITNNLGANTTLGGFRMTTSGGNVTVGVGAAASGTTLTLNGAGTNAIDMSNAIADLTIGATATGGNLRWASGNFGGFTVAASRTLTLNSNFTNQGNNKTIAMTGAGNIVFNGAAGGGVAMGFSIQGGSNVTMNGAGFWGGTSSKEVIHGTLNIGNDSALGSVTLNLGGTNASTPTITASGAARTIANNITLLAVSVAGNATIAGSEALTINGTVTNSGASRTLSVNNSALTTFGTGGIALSEGGNRTLTINGTGNATISGLVVNGGSATASGLTYSGSGVLSLTNANTFGGALTATSGTTRIDNVNAAQNATVSIGAANAVAFGTGITSATFAGLSGSGDLALTNTGAGNVVLSVGNNNLVSTYTGAFSGGGSITKIGTGTTTFNGNSSAYTGGVALNNGTLGIGNSNGAGTNLSTITAVTGTTVFANSSLGGNGVNAAIALSGANANVTLTNANASGGFNSAISGSADQTLTISQAGGQNVNLNASNKQLQNFSGTVSIASGQNLAFRATALNNGSDNALFDVNGSLSTRNNGNVALGALSGNGTVGMGGSGGNGLQLTYTIGARNSDSNFGGTIQEADALNGKIVNVIKTGSGIQTLSGANSYTGSTTIAGGTLALSGAGSLASPNIIVGANTTFDVSAVTNGYTLASTQTLSGSGTVAGTMNVSGTLSPGSSPGTLATGNQVWSDGGDYNWQIVDALGVAGTGYDTTAITGTLDLSSLTAGGFAINLWSLASISPDTNGNAANFNEASSYSWTLASTTGGITGFNASNFAINTTPNNNAAGFSNPFTGTFAVQQSDANNLVLSYSAVPEPNAAMLVGGLGMLALVRRRRSA